MIELAMVHTMELEKWIRNNYDGTKQFEPKIVVKCYKDDKTNKVITKTGEEVVSKSSYYTTKKVEENDRIDNNDILSIERYNILGVKYYRSYV
jgi:hypothetical protein